LQRFVGNQYTTYSIVDYCFFDNKKSVGVIPALAGPNVFLTYVSKTFLLFTEL